MIDKKNNITVNIFILHNFLSLKSMKCQFKKRIGGREKHEISVTFRFLKFSTEPQNKN